MKLLDKIATVSDKNFWLLFTLAVMFSIAGFLFHSDLGVDDSPIAVSYSLSLGAKCEVDYSQCHIRPRPVVAYRVETTRNEVVAFMPGLDETIAKYGDCNLWDTSNWDCDQGRISMRDGMLTRNAFEPDSDVYYVPKVAWKLAKMHILPLNSVRKAPPPAPQGRKA